MRSKTLVEAFAVLVTMCATSWAEGSPQDAGDRIGSGSQTLALDLGFYPLPPCRAVDTRAGAPLTSGTPSTFQIGGICGVPGMAKALSINVTAIGPTANGFVTLWPADLPEPATSTINFRTATTRANNAVVTLATDGSGRLSAKALLADSGSVHLVIDVTGYMARDPLAPCLCPIDGAPVPAILSINPSAGSVGSTVTLAGSSLAENPQVLLGDAATGNSALILSSSSNMIGVQVPPPPPGFNFSTEPCDGDGDGILDGTRNIPTPITWNAQSLDGTGCVATLGNAFTLFPADTTCNPGSPPSGFGAATMEWAHPAKAALGGDPVTRCQCPTHGAPLPQLLGITPSGGAIGSTVTLSGQSFASLSRVVFGDATTGSAAPILAMSATSITARVPTPPPDFRYSTEPCDGNGDGIPAGVRLIPTPIAVNVLSLDGTACLATLDDAFALSPPQAFCVGDNSTPPPARRAQLRKK